MTFAKMKSAKARSGDIPLNSARFRGLVCTRKHTKQKRITFLANTKTVSFTTGSLRVMGCDMNPEAITRRFSVKMLLYKI